MLSIHTLAAYFTAKLNVNSERGATAVEYGLMVALIALAIILGVTALGTNLGTMFTNIATKIGGVVVP